MSNASDLEIQIIFIIGLVMATFVTSHVAKHKGLAFMQESVVGVLIGLLVGLFAMLSGWYLKKGIPRKQVD
jgi:uncharacterized membrane protein